MHSTCCTTMKCTHCQKDFCCPVSSISASYSQLPSSKDNAAVVCSLQKALPSRVGKSSDVRYRSFHNFNQSATSKQVLNQNDPCWTYCNEFFWSEIQDAIIKLSFSRSVHSMEPYTTRVKAEHPLLFLIPRHMPWVLWTFLREGRNPVAPYLWTTLDVMEIINSNLAHQ